MTEAKPRLGRDVYLSLAAVGWADGQLDPDEADAIVRTALEEGLELEDIAEIEAATKAPLDVGIVDRRVLTKEDRLFVYAVGCWLATLDGVVTTGEEDALAKLAATLRIPERPRASAFAVAQEVAAMPAGDRPARFDLVALRRLIGERLQESQAAR